jgi:nitroimidazol reductase NimA-like FMN-containing flavoprotein (pyridoxamine 5'-phosphate oxidase superfamily)
MTLPDSVKELIRAGALGHLVTNSPSGSPQVSVVWVAVDGDDLLTAHLNPRLRKLENVRRDPRVAVSFEGRAAPGARARGVRMRIAVERLSGIGPWAD